MPSTSLTGSMRPSTTAKRARSPPSCTAYSPGTRLISAAVRESRFRSAGPSAAKILISPISSVVTMAGDPVAMTFVTQPSVAHHERLRSSS